MGRSLGWWPKVTIAMTSLLNTTTIISTVGLVWSSCWRFYRGSTIRYDYYDDSSPIFTSPLLVRYSTKATSKAPNDSSTTAWDGWCKPDPLAEVEAAEKDIVVTTAYDAIGWRSVRRFPYAVTAYVYNKIAVAVQDDRLYGLKNRETTTIYDALGRAQASDDARWGHVEMAYGVDQISPWAGAQRSSRNTQVTGRQRTDRRK